MSIANATFVKNKGMSRIIDYLSAGLILSFLSFALSMLATNSIAISVLFSVAFSFAILFSIRYFSSKYQKPYSCYRLELELCIRENEYTINLLKSITKNAKFESGCNYILLKNSIIIANFKFSALSYQDVSNACKIAKEHKKDKIYMLAKGIDRRAYQIAQVEQMRIELVKAKQLYKYLAKHNALPDLKKTKRRFELKYVIEIVLARRNLKNYLFSGIVLICVSFLTPLKIYYLVIGALSLLFALLCLTPLGSGSITSPKLFEEMERENDE